MNRIQHLVILLLAGNSCSCSLQDYYQVGEARSLSDSLLVDANIEVSFSGNDVVRGRAENPDWLRADADFYAKSAVFDVVSEMHTNSEFESFLADENVEILVNVASVSFDEGMDYSGSYPEVRTCLELTFTARNSTEALFQCSSDQRGDLVRIRLVPGTKKHNKEIAESYLVAFRKSIHESMQLALQMMSRNLRQRE